MQSPSPSSADFLQNLTIAVVDHDSRTIFVEIPPRNPSDRQTAFAVQETSEVLDRNYDETKASRLCLINDDLGGQRKYYARRSPPWPFCALNLADSKSSSKSSSFTSPGVKTLPASNSSFFSLFFRFFGFSSTCCGIGCLHLRGVRIEEIDSPARPVVHDQHRPIDHLDIEGVA